MCISEHTVPESANANVIRQLGNHHRLAHTYTINQLCQWAFHNGLYFSDLYQNAEKFLKMVLMHSYLLQQVFHWKSDTISSIYVDISNRSDLLTF